MYDFQNGISKKCLSINSWKEYDLLNLMIAHSS